MNPARSVVATAAVLVVPLLLGACGKSSTTLGDGGSVISGSAGPAGAHKASRELVKCEVPVATLALVENPNGYAYSGYQLPASPVPLVRLLAQQSGCFRVVDRAAGLKATVREQELKEAGVLRQEDRWVRVADLADIAGGSVMRITAPGPVERIVATWYRVGDTTTQDETLVKIETMKARLLGGPQRAVAIHLSVEGADPRPIARFLAALGPIGSVADHAAGMR